MAFLTCTANVKTTQPRTFFFFEMAILNTDFILHLFSMRGYNLPSPYPVTLMVYPSIGGRVWSYLSNFIFSLNNRKWWGDYKLDNLLGELRRLSTTSWKLVRGGNHPRQLLMTSNLFSSNEFNLSFHMIWNLLEHCSIGWWNQHCCRKEWNDNWNILRSIESVWYYKLLVHKLEHYGFHGVVLEWFKMTLMIENSNVSYKDCK